MAFLQRVARGVGGPLEAHATLALGCLTLAAYLTGVIAQRYRIPRIVGYLFAGFALGPAWLRLVRGPELQALAASLGFSGTPTLVRDDGTVLFGYLPDDKLVEWIDKKQ